MIQIAMMIKKTLTLVFLIPLIGLAQVDNPEYPSRQVTDNGVNGMTIEYQFKDFQLFEIQKAGKTFNRISIPGFSHLHKEGLPALPSGRDLILIPEDGKAEIRITKIEADTLRDILVFPAQPLQSDGHAMEEEQAFGSENSRQDQAFVFDSVFYEQDHYYPEKIVRIDQKQKIRDMPVGIVHITPFMYNPGKRELVIIRELKYEVAFSGTDHYFNNISKHTPSYLQTLPGKFLNSRSLSKEIQEFSDQAAKSAEADYLIVNHSMFRMAADTLAAWKRQLGHKVRIIERSYWTSDQVKDSIHAAYNTASTYPDYFIILGDQEHVPAELVNVSKNRYSDHYYACMGGPNDFFPDMARGRITAKTQAEALSSVKKIMNYEKDPPQQASFYTNALVAAYFQDDDTTGYASRRFVHTCEEVKAYLEPLNYSVERVYNTDPWVTPTHYNDGYYSNGQPISPGLLRSNGFPWDGGSADVINALDNGKFIALHRDHGSTNGWADPPFHSSHVAGLNNAGQLPVVFSMNCSSGKFINNRSFAENLIRKPNGGAAGVMAASATSYSGPNDALSVGFFDAIWANPGLTPNFGSGGVSNPAPSPHQNIRQMGDVLNHGLLRMTETWGNSKTTHELFHYHGDPAMTIWTEQPNPLSVAFQDSLSCGDTSLSITASSAPDATVTLLLNGEVTDRIQLSNGTGNLSFAPITNAKPYAVLTISSQGSVPYIAQIPVVNCSNPPLAKYALSDSMLSCYNNKASFYNNSLYQPDTIQWDIQPSSITYVSGSAFSDKMEVRFNDTGYYDVKLRVSNSFGVDSVMDDQRIYVAPATPAPYLQTVDSMNMFGISDTSWQAFSNSSYEWFIHRDSTPSFQTGPIYDHTTGTDTGGYFYTEASSGKPGDTALLLSPELDISALATPALQFWYHLYGAAINELHVEVNDGTGWQQLKRFYGQKQTGYDDPWEKALLDLSSYSGSCIKIRFKAVRGNGYKGDIAVDDIEIFDYQSKPEILAKYSTTTSCCGFTVEFEDLSCCGITNTEWSFPGGNPSQSTQKDPVVTYDTAGVYDVMLKAENIHGADSIIKSGKISVRDTQALPVFENFENFVPGNPGLFYNDWVMEKTHDFAWRVGSGSTPSSGTGPVHDHTTATSNGVYVYTEVSHVSETEESYLITPCLELPANENIYMTFWAHMYGAGTDTIHVDVRDGQQWHKNVFSIGGEQQPKQTDDWKKFTADLSAFSGDQVMLRFRAARTSSWKDDKAIDDVHIFAGEMKLSPDSVDFGSVPPGDSAQRHIQVINASPDTIVLEQSVSPQHFDNQSVMGLPVAPNDTMVLPVNFIPDTATDYNGYLSVSSNLNADSVYVLGKGESVDVDRHSKGQTYEVFPNPANEKINIVLPDPDKQSAYRIAIINSNGKIVDQWESKKRNVLQRNVRHLAKGVYQIRITSRDEIYTTMFVKF
ncbi:MAG: C25 family cysteine peptidase [Bacteroidales bacterium]